MSDFQWHKWAEDERGSHDMSCERGVWMLSVRRRSEEYQVNQTWLATVENGHSRFGVVLAALFADRERAMRWCEQVLRLAEAALRKAVDDG